MTREIKFRFWDNAKGIMHEELTMIELHWKCEKDPSVYVGGGDFIYPNGSSVPHYSDGHLMQYTGLKDRNRVEIYDSEIIIIEPYQEDSFVVVVETIDNVPFCIRTTWTEEYDVMPLAWYINKFGAHTIEVAGNIYQHPHLLEQ